MVLSVLNTDCSLRNRGNVAPEKNLLVSPQKPNRRSRAHNVPGGIKHLLSDPKRRRRVSARSISQSFSRRRSTRLPHNKPANLATTATEQRVLASSAPAPASGSQLPQPQIPASVPISVTFPRRLPELPRKQISSEVLTSLGFAPDVPSQYIRDKMDRLGPIMYQTLRSTKASASGSTLPKTLVINLDSQTPTLPPTHMVAVYSSAPTGPEPRRVMMYPIHQSILSLYCANLPVLATSTPLPTTPDAPFEVPVVPLALPNPESFPLLTQFLYLKDIHPLLDSFLCLSPAKGIPSDLDQPARYDAFVNEYATILAQNYTVQRLSSQAMKLHGLWRNACALGISDRHFQTFLDLAWEVLMKALTLSSNSAPVVAPVVAST